MCSFSWQRFPDHIGIAFNRDESVLRAKAHKPQIFDSLLGQYIMPIDPVGKGSWLAVNNSGIAICLLNHYQGQMKPESDELCSRGQVVKSLIQLTDIKDIKVALEQLPLSRLQPFELAIVSSQQQIHFCYKGFSSPIIQERLPTHLFSSGHPEAEHILAERHQFAKDFSIASMDDLLALHRSHIETSTIDAKAASFCMHKDVAHSQSLTYIKLMNQAVEVRYWDGQPCEVDHLEVISF